MPFAPQCFRVAQSYTNICSSLSSFRCRHVRHNPRPRLPVAAREVCVTRQRPSRTQSRTLPAIKRVLIYVSTLCDHRKAMQRVRCGYREQVDWFCLILSDKICDCPITCGLCHFRCHVDLFLDAQLLYLRILQSTVNAYFPCLNSLISEPVGRCSCSMLFYL